MAFVYVVTSGDGELLKVRGGRARARECALDFCLEVSSDVEVKHYKTVSVYTPADIDLQADCTATVTKMELT